MDLLRTRRVDPVCQSPRTTMYGFFTHGTVPPSRPYSSGFLSLPNCLRRLPSPARSFANNRSGQKLLCRNTFISVMKSAELWNCDNLSTLQRSRGNGHCLRGSGGFSIHGSSGNNKTASLEVASVQDDVVVQTFPSNRADESLGVWILPGTLWCRQNLLHAQRLDSQSNLSTVPAVPIADKVMRSLSVGEC